MRVTPPSLRLAARAASIFLCVAAPAASQGQDRYVLRRDPASRHGSAYVQDRVTGRWPTRECQLRVEAERPLPEPLTDPEHGDRLSVQIFRPETVESAYVQRLEPAAGRRLWRIRDVLDEADLAGRVAYGVQVEWPGAGEETRVEALELFRLPPLGDQPPDRWSAWLSAGDRRAGAFAWWDEVHGSAADSVPPPEHPFELRCRLVPGDVPGLLP